MTIVKVTTETGAEGAVQVARNDLIAEVKARIVRECFPLLRGQMISLHHRGLELQDEKSVGDYGVRNLDGVNFAVSICPRQPYSKVDYDRLATTLQREGFKKPPANFYVPGDEWTGKWTRGNEYMEYPPVDVHNVWTVIPPSSSRELTKSPNFRPPTASTAGGSTARPWVDDVQSEIPERVREKRRKKASQNPTMNGHSNEADQEERERDFRRARQKSMGTFGDDDNVSVDFDTPTFSEGRAFQSIYACLVRGSRFEIFHKMEGKWVGEASFTGPNIAQQGRYACSAKVGFLMSKGVWTEKQQLTNEAGMSSSQNFLYIPRSDGRLSVQTDSKEFMGVADIKAYEIGPNVVVITATSVENGQPILTETITFSNDFQKRTRTGQRFNSFGAIQISFVISESKYVDTESGALEPFT